MNIIICTCCGSHIENVSLFSRKGITRFNKNLLDIGILLPKDYVLCVKCFGSIIKDPNPFIFKLKMGLI